MFLYLQAELENIFDLDFPNSLETPYEFEFELKCSKCHEIHPKPIQINMFESHEILGSKGEANYVASCKFCQSRGNISISKPKGYSGYNLSGEKVKMLEIDSRGFEIQTFKPIQPLIAKGFDDVNLEDGEWYDYDDNLNEQVSITDVKWTISN